MKVIKNYIYNLSYEILCVIIPFVMLPYLSRTIGASGTGIYSYTHTIEGYFVLIAMLGIRNYGARTIAKVRDNRKELSKTFWNIYYMQIASTVFAVAIYIVFVIFFEKQYSSYLYIQSIFIISCIFEVSWLFAGLEDFKSIVLKNLWVKIFSILGIIIFVKDSSDLLQYTIIMACSTLIGNFIIWKKLKGIVDWCNLDLGEIKKHIRPNILLFVSIIAVGIYKNIDRVIIKQFSDIKELGYYEFATKINSIQAIITSSLGSVLLPKIASSENKAANSKIMQTAMQFVMFLSIGMSLGLIGISKDFVPIYLGNEFSRSATILNILAISGVLVAWSGIIRTVYLLPKSKDKVYVSSVIFAMVLSIALNLGLVYTFKSIGAAVTIVLIEAFIVMYQTFMVRKEIPLKVMLKDLVKFLPSALLMLLIVTFIGNNIANSVVKVVIKVVSGGATYLALNVWYIKKIISLSKISMIKDKENRLKE